MNIINKKLALAASVFLFSTAAAAGGSNEGINTTYIEPSQEETVKYNTMAERYSFYLTASGVYNMLRDSDTAVGAAAGEAEFDDNWGALIAIGQQLDGGFMKGMRGELELGWRRNEVDSFTTGGVTAPAGGEINAYSAMANVYYDMINSSRFTPYIGVGIGAADIEADGVTAAGTAGSIDDNDVVFAYQGIAGIGYAFNRSWALQTEYRYFGTTEAEMTSSAGAAADMDYGSHSIVVGLKYNFY